MRTSNLPASYLSAICLALLLCPISTHAWEPNTKDLDKAISQCDFGEYYTNATTWLNQEMPDIVTEDTLKELLNDSRFVTTLDQYQFIYKCGMATLGAFAKADKANEAFLTWLLQDSDVMDLYLEAGAVPTGEKCVPTLTLWSKIFNEDRDSRQGIYLKLAIATALVHPVPFRDERSTSRVTDPYEGRYLYYKNAHQNGELVPTFDHLSVWEYQKVVDGKGAPPEDLTWVRNMIHTWRPDLKKSDYVVKIASEVKFGHRDISIVDMASVLDGGGLCSRRALFGRKTCAAFGIPSIAILQKNHAALATIRDGVWKVEYGAGWQFSWCETGQDGLDFVAEAVARSHVVEFSKSQHLKWFASALTAKETAEAITAIAEKIVPYSKAPKAMVKAPGYRSRMDADVVSQETSPTVASTIVAEGAIKLNDGTTRIDAADFHSMTNVMVYDSYPDGTGKQVNFQKNIDESWINYSIDAPETGMYSLVLKLAAPNRDQILCITAGSGFAATNTIPNTRGLWATTPPLDMQLAKGEQELRIAAPYQRGIAVKWLELKHKP